MATYSSNTTIKVNSAVAANRTSSGTIYTNSSATGYALLNLAYRASGTSGTNTITITVGGQEVFYISQLNGSAYIGQIVVGPSQSVACTISLGTGGAVTVSVSGALFINTP